MQERNLDLEPERVEEWRELKVLLPAHLWEAVCDEADRATTAPSDMLAALVEAGQAAARQTMAHERLMWGNAQAYRNARYDAHDPRVQAP